MQQRAKLIIYLGIAYLIAVLTLIIIEDNKWGDRPFTPDEMARWRSYANHNNNGTEMAYDGNNGTRWTTLDPMVSGLHFQVDMGQIQRINKVMLYSGPDRMERPKGYLIETSLDGETWQKAASGWNGPPRLVIRFRPVAARFVRITETLMEPTNPWSIYEMKIYKNHPPFTLPNPLREVMILSALCILIAIVWIFQTGYFRSGPKDVIGDILGTAIISLFVILLIIGITGGLYFELFGRSVRLVRYDLLAYMIAALWFWKAVRRHRWRISSLLEDHPLFFFLAFFLAYSLLWTLYLKDKEMKVGGNFHLFFEKIRGFLGK